MAARNMTTGKTKTIPLARFSAQARLQALQADIMELILERDLVPGDPFPRRMSSPRRSESAAIRSGSR